MTKPWEETWTVRDGEVAYRVVNEAGDVVLPGPMRQDDAELAAAAPDLVRALLAVEWVHGIRQIAATCPACMAEIALDHAKNCPIDAALRKAGVR